jgi:hypothetical protein
MKICSRRTATALALILSPAMLGGCLAATAVSVAGNVVEGAVNVTGDVAEGAVNTAGAVIPDGDDDKGKED